MKKATIYLSFLLLILLIFPSSVFSVTTFNCNGLTGNTQRDLDYLPVSDIYNGDRAVVLTGTIKYHFKYDSTATNAENITTHPYKVRPEDYSSAGVWIEQELATGTIDAAMIAASAVGTSEIDDGTVATADLATGAITLAIRDIPGLVVRPQITMNSDSVSVYISSFTYDHQGTTEQLVYSSSSILFTFQSTGSNVDSDNLAATDWFYLYIDDSAVVTAGTNLIAPAQILAVTEEPVKSEAKNGYYGSAASGNATANDRLIAAFYTDSGSLLKEFSHDGGDFVGYADTISGISAQDIDNIWTDVTLDIPAFGNGAKALISIQATYNTGGGGQIRWRKNGQAGGSGHRILQTSAEDSIEISPSITVFVDATQKIEVKMESSTASVMSVWTEGYYLPSGL